MSTKDTGKLIVTPRAVKEIAYHDMGRLDRELGTSLMKYMDNNMVPEADLNVFIRKVERDIPEELDLGFTPHKHDVSQLYCLVGEVRLEVTLGTDKHLVKAPAAIFIPAGTTHCFKYAGGIGYIVNILREGSYP